MPEIKVAELLALQGALAETVRHEVGLVRADFKQRFDDFSRSRDELEVRQQRNEQAIARLDERTKLSTRGFFSGLTRKQKAAVWAFGLTLGGSVLDGARHLGALLLTILQRGAHP